jgi:hypothetical protein
MVEFLLLRNGIMPFKSEKQRKYLFKNKPNVAKKFAKDSKKKTHKIDNG